MVARASLRGTRSDLRGANYKWIALSNTHARRAAGDARRLDHADRDARHLPRHPPRPAAVPANSFYLLWMILGFLVVTSVLVVSLGRLGDMYRPGADVQPRLRHLHGRPRCCSPIDWLTGRAGADLPDRLPDRAGDRRRLPARQLGGDPHRRVPGQPARHGAGHQQLVGVSGDVHRARARRPAGADRAGGWCS